MGVTEEWKPIPGYEGLYEASNLGRIKSVKRITIGTDGVKKPVPETILKPKTEKTGRADYRVSLRKNAEYKDFLVSRLVAKTWIPVPDNMLTVNHINGNFQDNRIENLEWVTLAENIRHGFKTGLYDSTSKAVALTHASTGEETKFKSMSEASRFLGRNTGYVSYAISRGKKCYDDYGIEYYARPLTETEYLGVKIK